MAFEGLLAKLGPTLVREVTPHLVQIVAGFGERFRKDTREIKSAVDAELASVARAHAGLSTGLDEQRDRIAGLQEQLNTVDRRIEILQRTLEIAARQAEIDREAVVKPVAGARTLALCAAICSGLALVGTVVQLVLHR